MLSWFRMSSTPPIAEQIEQLTACGLRLCPGVTLDIVKALPERAAMEAGGYVATLCALGAARHDARGTPHYLTDDAWYFDAACINGPGDYAAAIERLAQMLPEEFPARDADDSVNLVDWRASLSFELGDVRLHWTQRVLDRWIDETLFVRINQLVEEQADQLHGGLDVFPRQLWQVPLPGRHRLLLAATTSVGRRLAQACGLAVRLIV